MHKCSPRTSLIPHASFALLVPSPGSAFFFFFTHEIGPNVADGLRVSSRCEASRPGAQIGSQKGTQGWNVRQWSINEHGNQGQERRVSMVIIPTESWACQGQGATKSWTGPEQGHKAAPGAAAKLACAKAKA